jgi:uncharacterized repeat protein (TIGR01451 family)
MSRPSAARVAVLLLSVAVVLQVAAPLLVGPAWALVQGEPNVSLAVADNRVSAGESTTIEVNAVNRGELDQGSNQGNVEAERRVTTARGLTLSPRSTGPVTVRTNEVAIGSLSDGAAAPASFEVSVAEDAEPGTYRIPVQVEYRHTAVVSEEGQRTYNEKRVSVRRTISVVVDEEARFEVVNVTARSPGESGTFVLEVENTGNATANDAVASLSSLSGDLQFGEGEASTAYVSEWRPGTRRTLLFRGSVHEEAPVDDLPASLSVEYTDDKGVEFASESTIGISPTADQTFTFEPNGSNLRVGREGTVRGTFTNEGPGVARNVVLTLEPPGRNVEVLEPELALGDLKAGEAVDVTFAVEVSSGGRSGARQFSLTPDYETAGGEAVTADRIRFRETVQPRRDVFTVEATEANVSAGDARRVVLSVTNNHEENLTDISAKMFTSRPLSVEDDEAFIDRLEPGETAEIAFRVAAGDGAMTKDYPVSVDFQYVDETGETRLTDSYRVPVTVEESSGGLFGLFGLASTAALALALPYALFWRG